MRPYHIFAFFLLNRIYQAQWLPKFCLSLVCPPLLRCSMQQETEKVPSIRWVFIPCSIKNSFGAEAHVTKNTQYVVVRYQRCMHTGVSLQRTRPSRRCQRAPNHPSALSCRRFAFHSVNRTYRARVQAKATRFRQNVTRRHRGGTKACIQHASKDIYKPV